MSQENVDVVRAGIDAWNTGDTDGLREGFAPDVIVRLPEGWPEPGPFVGRDEVMRQWARNREVWDADTLEPTSFIDAGDRVVVRFIWRGVGRGPQSQLEFTAVYTLREGRISYQESFWDHSETLEAVGIPDQAKSRANIEVVRRWQTAMSAGREEALSCVAECFDADVDYYPVRKFPAPPCHGREEFRGLLDGYLDAFSRGEFAIQELIEVGEDRILIRENLRTEGRGSGVELEGNLYRCFWLRHGRFFRVEDHLTLKGTLHAFGLDAETLEAAGLSE